MNAIQNRYKMSDAKICGRASKKRERREREREEQKKDWEREQTLCIHEWIIISPFGGSQAIDGIMVLLLPTAIIMV